MKNIGILGGTFDPFHLGHLHAALQILQKLNLTEINIIPCYQSPHKIKPVASAKDRFEMVKLGINDNPLLIPNDIEIKKQEWSYTVNTLEELHAKKNQKEQRLFLIIGSDSFKKFNHWHKWQNILELTHLIVVNRPDVKLILEYDLALLLENKQVSSVDEFNKNPAGNILMVDIKPLPISATEIRKFIHEKNFAAAQKMVPQKIWEYILKHSLYF